jgi:nicotinate-nucleotide adenylyltransferase
MNIDLLVKESIKENLNKNKKRSSLKRIGIMGGTFDPIHFAHLATAEFIRIKYNLDKILFIPSGNPPHKTHRTIIDKYHRYNMVLLSTMTNENFEVSSIEIDRNEKTYTVDTLRELKIIYPDTEFYFITGADAICDIESWKDVEENFKLATFIAATRPGISLLKAQDKIEKLINKYNAEILTVYVPSLDISSTYIREQIKENHSIRYLIPESVEKYIQEKGLYK